MLIGALVAHHSYGADGGEQHGTGLPDVVVEARAVRHLVVVHLLDVDIIGILQDAHLLAGDVAKDTHGETWAREGMTLDETLRHLQLIAHAAHLVLEQPFQRFAELKLHVLGQPAHVVVALDGHAGDAQALDAVGIDGALSEPFGVGDLLSLGVEDLHEVAADDLALLLRVSDAFEVLEELLAGIHADDVQSQTVVGFHDLLELILAQHAVVDEDTREVLADGTVEQGSADAGVHTAGKTEDDAVVAELLFQLLDGGVDKRGRTPLLTAAADVDDKVAEQLSALCGVVHLGVELHAPHGVGVAGKGGVLHVGGGADDMIVARDGGDRVAVAHPHL